MPEERSGGGTLILIRNYMAAMRDRTLALKGRILQPVEWTSPMAAAEAALQELDTAHEELLVADEELRRQSEELERIRQGIAAELRRFRDLFDHSPDGYVETDPRGVVRVANRTLAAELNIPVQFLERKPLVSFVHRADCARFNAMLPRLAAGESVRGVSLRLRPRRAGAPFLASLHAVPVLAPSRQVLAVRWTVRTFPSAEDAPLPLTSVRQLADAAASRSSAKAAGKGVALSVEIERDSTLEPEQAARWLPIFFALVESEIAAAHTGSHVRIFAKREATAIGWRVGGASLSLPMEQAPPSN
jgi:PAS domain-containing protein